MFDAYAEYRQLHDHVAELCVGQDTVLGAITRFEDDSQYNVDAAFVLYRGEVSRIVRHGSEQQPIASLTTIGLYAGRLSVERAYSSQAFDWDRLAAGKLVAFHAIAPIDDPATQGLMAHGMLLDAMAFTPTRR